MKIWVITDTHFNHKNIVGYESRPENFAFLIFKHWAKLVKPEDLVIHLGDVIFAKKGNLDCILAGLPGKKVLVRGNHDKASNEWYMKKGFDFVCDEFRWKDVIFSHIPVDISKDATKYNVHGHLHRKSHRDEKDFPWYSKRHILVSIEGTFKPVLLKSLLKTA